MDREDTVWIEKECFSSIFMNIGLISGIFFRFDKENKSKILFPNLYYRVVVFRDPLQVLCATLKGMLWIGIVLLPQDGSKKAPTTALYQFVHQLDTARRFMWNKVTSVKCPVDPASKNILEVSS